MFNKVFESIRAQLRARSQDDALTHLSNEALEDIGLTRGDVIALQARSKPARVTQPLPDTSFVTAHPSALAHAA